MLTLHLKTALAMVLCAVACSQPGAAQVAPATILQIDLENYLNYVEDIPASDVSKLATNPNVTPAVGEPINFAKTVVIADMVAVNGRPARGTAVFAIRRVILRAAPNPGQAIADINRDSIIDYRFEI